MKSKNLKREKKPERLFKIVDKVLGQIFGEPATLFLFKYLEEKHSLKREDIPDELELFTEGLEKCLGDYGAAVVVQTLFTDASKLKLRKVEEKRFLEQLKEMKKIAYR